MSSPRRAGKAKRKNLVHNTPPTNNAIKKTKETQDNNQIDCLICDDAILDPGENTDGHDAVFCEGNCQGWIH